jgi:hypothetical protein
MPSDPNAALAVSLYRTLRQQENWAAADVWKSIAQLLLTCEIWGAGWQRFHDVVVFRERNDFKISPSRGPNATMRAAGQLTHYLATELNVPRADVCNAIGLYFKQAAVRHLQPNNLLGNAFRSLIVEILRDYGSPNISYNEEVDPLLEFPGHTFTTRSKNPRIDIVARKGNETVALLSTRWRYRHDRVDLVDEAFAYVTPAKRTFPSCRLFAVVGEFNPARLLKVLDHSVIATGRGPIDATVHFNPLLISAGLGGNGRLAALQSLAWLIGQTFTW